MSRKAELVVKNINVNFFSQKEEDYISLTDIAKYKNSDDPRFVIQNWMKTRSTVEFLGIWEVINNPCFNRVEFDTVKNEAGSNAFVLTPSKWIKLTQAVGIVSKSGRYGGGTYAHKDIAFEFASWISAEFKLYLIKEFQRLKEEENKRKQLGWDIKRNLAKINYRIHTDAIKENLIPPELTPKQVNHVYASEADVLNMALFGETAKQWRKDNPDEKGNIRDYANVSQLVCLSNMESLNAHFINEGMQQQERLNKLNTIAIAQMKTLVGNKQVKKLKGGKNGAAS
jgi:hypothetical protein